MDRLVQLFLQAMRMDPEGGPAKTPPMEDASGRPTLEALERGMASIEAMLTSDQALQAGADPSATLVLLGMALEEKPKLRDGAILCYERALEWHTKIHGELGKSSWERCVVLQQLGAICIQPPQRLPEADRWLADCAALCVSAPGHPRDAALFGGGFTTQQTKNEFRSNVELQRAKCSHHMGDEPRMRQHYGESQRLEQKVSGFDAVAASATTVAPDASAPSNRVEDLWKVDPKEQRRLTEYSYSDNGPTVTLMLNLNDHLGLGDEASSLVDSLRQFRVCCEKDTVDIRLRMFRREGVTEFRLLLSPLTRGIVPEDTVPKLRGKTDKRRLEVMLFKADKAQNWTGNLVSEKSGSSNGSRTKEEPKPASAAEKGTLLNPLTAAELAALPTPGTSASTGAGAENRPSAWARGAGEGAAACRRKQVTAAEPDVSAATVDEPPLLDSMD